MGNDRNYLLMGVLKCIRSLWPVDVWSERSPINEPERTEFQIAMRLTKLGFLGTKTTHAGEKKLKESIPSVTIVR